jgi:flagellar biosynthetic protein FlhB
VSEDQSQRTEPATPTRLEEARKEGQLAISRDVQHVVVLGAIWSGLVAGLGGLLAARVSGLASELWSASSAPPDSLEAFHTALLYAGREAGIVLMPVLALAACAGLASGLAQSGLFWQPSLLALRLERLSLVQGLKRMASIDRVVELLKAALQVALATGVAWWIVAPDLPVIVGWLGAPAAQSSRELLAAMGSLMLALLAAFVPIAILDSFWHRFQLARKLRMSKQEVRDEARQREGDPQARARHRTRHRTLSRSRMIAAVAAADVVIANPTHFAIALRYDPAQSSAPEVLAKGKDRVALRIREAAERHGVPVVEDKPLARLLHDSCEVGRSIPENLFQAVAEVLAYVYRLAPHRARRWRQA